MTASSPNPKPEVDPFGIPLACGFPEADSALMVEIDFLMTEGLGIALPLMKENAGRAFARLAVQRYLRPESGCGLAGQGLAGRRVAVLAGKGGNGDIALLTARRLADWGAEVSLILAVAPMRLGLGACREMAIHAALGRGPAELPTNPPDLILDGLFGYSLRGNPRGRAADLIAWANASRAPVLALDLPSGFDAQEGMIRDPAIRADATLALGLPKRGSLSQSFAHVLGALYLADISIPPDAWSRLSVPVQVPGFGGQDLVRILRQGEVV
jgi:NAD(P)H-hydrate epimerase